jgi:5-(carboxyamino)imidazole ribonucleotide mutase
VNTNEANGPLVAVLMGSASDKPVMERTFAVLDEFAVPYTVRILSAHRTPHATADFVERSAENGVRVFICGAGMAAHLAGVVAAHTVRPVLAVPLESGNLGGLDALLSSVQMPGGIPVGVFAVGKAGAKNAALSAVQILALGDKKLTAALEDHRAAQRTKVERTDAELRAELGQSDE